VADPEVEAKGGRGRSSTECVRVEVPKALREVGCGEALSPPHWEKVLIRGLCPSPPPKKNFFWTFEWKMAYFGAFWVLFFAGSSNLKLY